MKHSSTKRASLVLSILASALFAGATAAHYKVEGIRSQTRPEEVLYIPSAKTLKRMSLGYSGLMADIYWTRAVQYFGWKHKQRSVDYRLLYPLLDITTQLDPHLIVAYEFGTTFLAQAPPNGAGQPDKAVELIERGIQANPDNWRLYYDLGFLQAMELRDYVAAAQAFTRGSQVPGAHPFLKVVAAAMAQHGGDVETARMMWQTTLETTEDAMIKQNAQRHLQALASDDAVLKLEELIRQIQEKTGVQPQSLMDMLSAGYLRRIPTDPLGHPYKLRPGGRVEVQDPDSLPFIRQGLPPGYEPIRPNVPGLAK
jgi:hypothetical protein